MKNLKHINKLISGLVLMIFSSCSGIFVPDPLDPILPKYSEEGYNVAGAYVNGNLWRSVVINGLYPIADAPSVIVWPAGDSLSIIFEGEESFSERCIEFHLKGLNIKRIEDLLLLDGKKIQLDGTSNSGFYRKQNNPVSYPQRGIGQIYFRSVSRTDDLTYIKLSGTFGFSVNELGGGIKKISYGRFDYRIYEGPNFRIR